MPKSRKFGLVESDKWTQIRGLFVDRSQMTYHALQRIVLLDKLRGLDPAYYDELLEAVWEAWESGEPDSGNDDEVYVDGVIDGLDFANVTSADHVRAAS